MAKKAAANTGSIRKKTVTRGGKDYTYWEARYTAGFDPGTGKQIQRSVTGKTQKEVAQKLKAAVAAIDEGSYIAPNKMTVGEWLDIWQAEYLGGVKPATVVSYTGACKNHIKPALGAVKIAALQPHAIQAFYNSLTAENRPGGSLSAKTVKNVHGVLHKAMQQAVKNGYIKSNPAEACELPRIEKKPIKPMDSSTIALFLDAIQGNFYADALMVLLFTGIRRGELVGLTWDCVALDAGTMLINKQLQAIPGTREYHLVSTKSSNSRIFKLAPSVVQILRRQKARQAQWQLAMGGAWDNSTGFVFTKEDGEHISPHTLYHNYKRVVAQMGIPEARLHDLRHSYAVAAIHSGDDIKTVQSNLGHATASFTLDVYGHVTDQMRAASADRMERFIKSVSGS